MSDMMQAREAAIQAETLIENIFQEAFTRLHEINLRLINLHDEIKVSQPKKNGAICLELYKCGTGCTGCPHPRWVKYVWPAPKDGKEGAMKCINLDAQKADPILSLQRTENYANTASLIREAKSILEQRNKLLARIRPLRY